MELDSQQVESLGRAALTAALVADGLEVARPERDEGIDLVAFTVDLLKVMPIQMKAATGRIFSVHHKHERFDRLVMAYVWNARSPGDAEFYAMTWKDAAEIAHNLGWTNTQSWQKGGGYVTTSPSQEVQQVIAGHRMEAGKWRVLLDALGE